MKVKLVNKYEQYKQHEGTYQKGESKTDKSQAQDTEIYNCIEKYGIQSLMRQSQAKEPMYLDNTQNMTLDEAVRTRYQMDEYFKQMPARARKVFGDNPDVFYEKYKRGEYDNFLETGALTQEQVYELSGYTEREITNEERLEENPTSDDTNNT